MNKASTPSNKKFFELNIHEVYEYYDMPILFSCIDEF